MRKLILMIGIVTIAVSMAWGNGLELSQMEPFRHFFQPAATGQAVTNTGDPSLPPLVVVPYTTTQSLFIRERIEPKIIHIAGDDCLNPGAPPQYPSTYIRQVWKPVNPDLYGDDINARAELWSDSAGSATWPEIVEAFPELPGLMEAAVRKWVDSAAEAITSPYLPNERAPWPYQRADTIAWAANHSAPTPFIDALASERHIPREIFIKKVLENVALFEHASGVVFGRQQALTDLIYGAEYLADILDAVNAIGLKPAEVRND